ncbi:MAG: MaoC family dehydratase [Alphaproteobacteria bacterium GM202ARS2]|nr:MaoC family dehydratase [Alphaproteobacteria bacterium GM202ARS2]
MTIPHALGRTVMQGDVALYLAVTGSRFAVHCDRVYAQNLGYRDCPVDDILVFHLVFGRTVPDLSLNAVANLGYAGCRFCAPVYVGDTLYAESKVIGVKENSNGKTGTVYVSSRGWNQNGDTVLEYYRWLMMRKRDESSKPPEPVVPSLPDKVADGDFVIPDFLREKAADATDDVNVGSSARWDDYNVGDDIHHIDGQTIEEAEHQMATRLYQNNARVHFNQHVEKDSRFGRRIIYGGYIISLARALSANGLAHGLRMAAVHSGRHAAPTFAGDTVYAWSRVLDKQPIAGTEQLGTLRLRTLVAKDNGTMVFPAPEDKSSWPPHLVLDFDYSVLMPRRASHKKSDRKAQKG